ncbi:MAG: diguanylate cyclase [Candidatus Thiodiazotropha weberae]|nr:diguanylate cyclase [Candidatus Thiodiazotropha weberae]
MDKSEQNSTEKQLKAANSIQRLKHFLWTAHVFWLTLIVALTGWHIWHDLAEIDRLVNREANIRLQTANHVRKWIVGFGGVYAPVSDVHKPNPYIPESVGRDVETLDGRQLTIANSIAALNSIMGKENRVVGAFIRFTGDEPLKPGNEPDEWESMALDKLRAGKKTVAGYTEFEGKSYYRMLQPLALKPKCYKCHSYSQYKLGDIVGGLGVHVDMEVYSDARSGIIRTHLISYFVMWLIGTLGILFTGKRWRHFLQRNDELQQQLQDLAIHDPLTGFLNRHQADLIFDNELARAKRNKSYLSILIADIDNFKNINDTYGHMAGDKVLEVISSELGHKLRESDYMIRYGGDELMFILTDSTHAESIKKAELIRSMISEHTVKLDENTSTHITLSIGAASYPEHGSTIKELIKAADVALYKAKKGGRNQVSSAEDASGSQSMNLDL